MKFVKRSVAVLLTVAAANGAYAQSVSKADAALVAGDLNEAKTQIEGAIDKEIAKLQKKGKPVTIKGKTLLVKGNVYSAIALSDSSIFADMQEAAIDSALSAYNTIKSQEKETSAVYKDAWVTYAAGENSTYIQGKNSKVQDLYQGFMNKGGTAYNEEDFNSAMEDFLTASNIISTDTTAIFNAMICAQQLDEPDTEKIRELSKTMIERGATNIDAHRLLIHYTMSEAQEFETQLSELDVQKRQTTQEQLRPLEETLADYKDKAEANKAYMKKSKAAKDRYNKFSKLATETEAKIAPVKEEIAGIEAKEATAKEEANKIYAETLGYVENALEVHPTDANLQQTKIVLYMKMDKIDEAIAENKKSLEADPSNPELYFNIGLLYSNKMDVAKKAENAEEAAELEQKTIESYNKVLELNPNHYGALVNIGDFYYQKANGFNREVENLVDYTGKVKNSKDKAKVDALKADLIDNATKAKDYFTQAQSNQPAGDSNNFELLINRADRMIKNNQ
ncbi:tetratricopeptide repeat protein [Sediminitomix flava]|uniref:TPR repeat protein n=1 Tax=Sediminitomix flava TaxID=379075 RepID=A0A315ZDG4_SEDFL|nr:tetratricopeptide repeat protein [Sediminitomix flava]PWJ43362.1 TPR repeat protein [Sediminitomix flava]